MDYNRTLIENLNFKRNGHIDPFWKDDFKYLDYVKQPITDEEVFKWRSQGYDYVKSFTGSMYTNKNVLPSWTYRFKDIFKLKNQTYTFYKMSTLEIMPLHSDHYRTYISIFGAEYDTVCRTVIMLENWKSGHYLEVNGRAYVNWEAGDYFSWTGDCPHAASNIGVEDRYTLQITGELC
jgi:hypothetical protein